EIERGELVHVTLVEKLLADSTIAILVPRGREPTLPARIAMDAVRRQLRSFAKRLPRHGFTSNFAQRTQEDEAM
ncbi:MAG: hypothetical protein JO124_04300, partial [Hyphomicrobiales bacterium]|nr:hypothetical protein [Hyphomicrobiales bacterium]